MPSSMIREALPAPAARGRLTHAGLFWIFLKAGLAFGGGLGILAVLEDELVKRRRVVEAEDFLTLYGLGRIVPSGTMTALAVAYGYRFAGWSGTLVTLTALVLPAFVLTVALTAAYGALHGSRLLTLLPITILPGALAFIAVTAVRLSNQTVRHAGSALIALAAFVGAYVLRINPAILLLVGGMAGLLVFLGERAEPSEGAGTPLSETAAAVTAPSEDKPPKDGPR